MVVTTGVSSRWGSQVVGSSSTEGRLYMVVYNTCQLGVTQKPNIKVNINIPEAREQYFH